MTPQNKIFTRKEIDLIGKMARKDWEEEQNRKIKKLKESILLRCSFAKLINKIIDEVFNAEEGEEQ